jgi:hypothetical protein
MVVMKEWRRNRKKVRKDIKGFKQKGMRKKNQCGLKWQSI